MKLTNRLFGSSPLFVHGQGNHRTKVHWNPIREACLCSPGSDIGPVKDLTIVTCNNGHDAMGMLEQSLELLGVPWVTLGKGIEPWVNAREKPRLLAEGLREISTPYTLYADSRDVLCLGNPAEALKRFRAVPDCKLLFGADLLNWPNEEAFKTFEDKVAPEDVHGYRYMNAGLWIGQTEFAATVFEEAQRTPELAKAPESEQGILKQLFPRFHPKIQLDYRCSIFQNIGFEMRPILEIDSDEMKSRP